MRCKKEAPIRVWINRKGKKGGKLSVGKRNAPGGRYEEEGRGRWRGSFYRVLKLEQATVGKKKPERVTNSLTSSQGFERGRISG